MNKKQQWKTITTFKAQNARAAVELNQKGSYLQVRFGRLSFEQGIDQDLVEMVGGSFIQIPNQSSDIEAWASEMCEMVNSVAQKAKEILEGNGKRAERSEAPRRERRVRPGLRSLARLDAEKADASQDLAQKEVERKSKPKRSRQERVERDREIRAKMKKG